MVPAVHIAECLDESPTAQSACDRRIAMALVAGGKDNVTAVLARAKSQELRHELRETTRAGS
jgi:serine/threonine protein phosphatase PrpC